MKKPARSLVLSCDQQGTIQEIICDRIYEGRKKLQGRSVAELVDLHSRAKALHFLQSVYAHKDLMQAELNINTGTKIEPFHFHGLLYKDHMLMIISNASTTLQALFEEISAVNNEQANLLRSVSKQASRQMETGDGNLADDALEEISRLNNELVNMQRKLAVKNRELERLNQQLKEKSIRDPLTALYNRWFFYEKIDEEVNRAQRLGYTLILATTDINDFKQVNDRRGHDAGDQLLVQLAEIIKESIRQDFDSVFRFGGDEFVILFVNCSPAKAMEILEGINQKLVEKNQAVSLAYGIAEIAPGQKKDIAHCLNQSDQQMYAHKRRQKKHLS